MPDRDHSAIARKAARTRLQMRLARGVEPGCSECGEPRDTAGAYCARCRAAYMRDYRARQNKPGINGLVGGVDARREQSSRKIPRGTAAEAAQEVSMEDRLGNAARDLAPQRQPVRFEREGAARPEGRSSETMARRPSTEPPTVVELADRIRALIDRRQALAEDIAEVEQSYDMLQAQVSELKASL